MIPLWTILVATAGCRSAKFVHLMSNLLPQTEPYKGQVTVLALWNNGEISLPDLRDSLMYEAKSEYTCFVDDDDSVPAYYVSNVVPLLDGTVDYIGWKQQLYQNGIMHDKPTFHSLQYDGWSDSPDERGWTRDISHLNPIRRELAVTHASFAAVPADKSLLKTEDRWWAQQLRSYVKTERCVPEEHCMYYYWHDTEQSISGRGVLSADPGVYYCPEIVHPNFSWAAGSFM